jgi:hypothetical protein
MSAYWQESDLQRLWLQQLQLEYDDICWSYGLQLRAPVFEICATKHQLGSWQPTTRTLRLSSHLIVNHSWSITLQVLKHEMAHQLCSELFADSNGVHGEAFQKACEILGVIREFRCAGTLLPKAVAEIASGSQVTERGRKCIAKVEKLLALAGSSNEHEASLAMRKANDLIQKYNINSLANGQSQSYGSYIIDRKKKRIATYQRHICRILQEFFYVRVVMSSLYDPLRNEIYKTIELLGTQENVVIAEYCYSFLDNQLNSLWSQNRKRFSGSTKTEKNSYFLGLLRGVYDTLQAQQNTNIPGYEAPAQAGDLISIDDKKLDEFVSMKFPRLKKRKASGRGVKVYRNTFNEGQETGKSIVLSKGISGENTQSGKFLS